MISCSILVSKLQKSQASRTLMRWNQCTFQTQCVSWSMKSSQTCCTRLRILNVFKVFLKSIQLWSNCLERFETSSSKPCSFRNLQIKQNPIMKSSFVQSPLRSFWVYFCWESSKTSILTLQTGLQSLKHINESNQRSIKV